MTGIENNMYYQGLGSYKGDEAQVYYDHHKQLWEVQLVKNNEWVEDVDVDEIELG